MESGGGSEQCGALSTTEKCPNALQIFCRLRPRDTPPSDSQGVGQIVRQSDTVLALRDPKSYLEQQFLFEHVFEEYSTQECIFQQVGRPLLHSVFRGRDALLFAYGVTSSGKSHTINGTAQMPGLIPRTLDYLFQVLTTERLNTAYRVLSDLQNSYQICRIDTNQLPELDLDLKLHLSAINRKKYQQSVSEWSRRVKTSVKESPKVFPVIDGRRYSIFLSFVEIYNNYIYDLLAKQSADCIEWKRVPHQLRQDANQMVYVSGASEIEVRSADQALKLFLLGLQNRRMAGTGLNANSSRSHSVFTLKVVSCDERTGSNLKVAQLSIVDLAGMERTNRTHNTGAKLFETSNINNSLTTLRRCFEAIQKNNKKACKPVPIPYRDCKLTYLFKRFFEFHSQIRMIICLKPDVDDLEENIHVLNFGQKAQKIVIEDLQDKGDELGDTDKDQNQTSQSPGVFEINLARFRSRQTGSEQLNGAILITELQKFMQSYQSDSNKIMSAVRTILERLDTSLKSYPERQLDKESITLESYRSKFNKYALKFKQIHETSVQRKSTLLVDQIANTPLMIIRSRQIEKDALQGKRLLIEELRRDVQVWENEKIEIMNKLKSNTKASHRYVNLLFGQKMFSRGNQMAKMDVFIRLYNQTPQRYRTEGKNKAKLMNTSTRFTPSLAKQAKTWSILRDTHCIRKVPSLHKVNHGESSSTKQKQEEIGKLQNKRRLFN